MYLTESLIKQLTKESDLKSITHLDIESSRGDRKLVSIENLHPLQNLTHLNLRGNSISRIDGLSSLLQLLHLNLADNHIEKIEGLDSLSRLSLLDLSANRIERIPSLKRLGALRVLRVSSNRLFRLDDITALKSLLSLHHLSVKNNPFCDCADPSGVIIFHLPSLLTVGEFL
jgi:Leucine-rich repeat (LRR) protein